MARERGSRISSPGHELLESARQLRWRVPELALLFANRATAAARQAGDTEQRLRAEAIALFAENRLGRSVTATERALGAFRDAERAGSAEPLGDLRVELACCARGSGSPDVALRVLHPLLELERVPARLRAHALVELCGALPMHRRAAERVEALDEADRLYAAESTEDQDTTRLLRARVAGARAAHYRGNGEFALAIESATAGLDFLERLGDPAADSGEVRAGLVLEQAQSLLDLGKHAEALRCASEIVRQPLRAAAAAPVGWLRLAVATRVYVPSGQHSAAFESLREALDGGRRHELFDLQAAVLNTLSALHEKASDLPEALRCVRDAYSADHHWRRTVERARLRLLEEFPVPNSAIPRQQSEHGGQDYDPHGHTVEHPPRGPLSPTAGDTAPVTEDPDTRQQARRLMNTLLSGGAPSTRDSATVPHQHEGTDIGDRRSSGEGDDTVAHRSDVALGEVVTASGTVPGRRHRAPDGAEEHGATDPHPHTPAGSVAPVDTGTSADPVPPGVFDPSGAASDTARQGEPDAHRPPRDHGGREDIDFPAENPTETGFDRTATESGTGPGIGSGSGFPSSSRDEDVTAIMPVVPSFPDSELRGEEVGEHAVGNEAWPVSDPQPGGTTESVEPHRPRAADSSSGPGSEPLQEHATTGPSESAPPESAPPESGTTGGRRRAEPTETEEPPTRRSHGRSLDEIRAALEAEGRGTPRQRRSRSAGTAEVTGEAGNGPESATTARSGGRRRRAEPPEPAASGEPAESTAPAGSGGSETPPERGDNSEETSRDTSSHPPVPEHLLEQSRELIRDFSGMDVSDSAESGAGQEGLADLLAEALVAYRNGNRADDTASAGQSATARAPQTPPEAPEPPSGANSTAARRSRRSGDPEMRVEDEPTARTGTDDTAFRGRRRHAAGETEPGESYSWTPRIR
ncbi:tetratricopeptide (TPR) repeat protein [Actinopolyspora lacussalsi]|nr:tetratricopeptide (TPR) repeat protein [Actinopolyspora lacussalsi]